MKKILFILCCLSMLSLQGCFVGRPYHGDDHRGGGVHHDEGHHEDHH